MRTLALALRNLLRNRRRSLTTLFAMVIGAVTILVFGGYSRNITYGLQTSFVVRGGHLQIQRKDYFLYGTGNPAAYGIADYQRVIDVVSHDHVLAPISSTRLPVRCNSRMTSPAISPRACRAPSSAREWWSRTAIACSSGTTIVFRPNRHRHP